MNVLVIGSGGREHALVRALRAAPSVQAVHCAPGSEGIAKDAICVGVSTDNPAAITGYCVAQQISLVVVGPEVPLVAGLSDDLRKTGIAVFGPGRDAARLEGSKVFSKEFMLSGGIPTARAHVVKSVAECLSAAREYAPPYVLKADGLAAGKGVTINRTLDDLRESATDLFERNTLGEAGAQALLEEFSPGYELSYLVLTNGHEFTPLPLAQDHKRLCDGDEGPNTGGMGTIAPMKIANDLRTVINETIVATTLRELQRRKMDYRGVIFIGLMITPQGPLVIEYNVRFGDPETQVILPLLDGDWGAILADIAAGKMPVTKWHTNRSCACVVLAAPGYPQNPVRGELINSTPLPPDSPDSYLLHAGTKCGTDGWTTNGGRVLNVVGLGSSVQQAIHHAYRLTEKIGWKTALFRRDIGKGSKPN